MFLSADDNRGGILTAGDGTLICMSVPALEEELLIERDDPMHLSLPKNLLIFLQKNQQTTKLVERECQWLAVQKLVVQGLVVLDCLKNFLIRTLTKLLP